MDDWKERKIREDFGGDEKKFEKAYNNMADDAIKDAVSWEELNLLAILPELAEQTQTLIKALMGYLPPRIITAQYEPYLRALVQQLNQGSLSEEKFLIEAKEHLKLIRNRDLRDHSCIHYADDIVRDYYTNFNFFSYMVKKRFEGILGYEPNAKHAMMGEIWYRDAIVRGEKEAGSPVSELDYKIIAIIKYREVLLEQGKDAADQSPVWDIRMILDSAEKASSDDL